jgi:pullulanase/glycogen debranching enzyme
LLLFLLRIFAQVDGFRFDIMGHHFVHNMTNIRNAINALTPERDGVDGRHMYIYGEAWDFGEVALNQRGRNASQHNLGGSRIGAFNDRCVVWCASMRCTKVALFRCALCSTASRIRYVVCVSMGWCGEGFGC